MPRPSPTLARHSHCGVCVSDLDRSLAFYRNVFHFTDGGTLELTDELVGLAGLGDDLHLKSQFLRLGFLVVELMYWERPKAVGPASARPMNQLGLTHFSFNVDLLEPVLEAVERWGGHVLRSTRKRFAFPHMEGEIIFVTDPDGARIELMAFPEDVQLA